MRVVTISELRRNLARIADAVASAREPAIVQRHGKPLMALVPLEDLALLDELEDRLLVEEADRILADPNEEWVPWEQAKAELDATA